MPRPGTRTPSSTGMLWLCAVTVRCDCVVDGLPRIPIVLYSCADAATSELLGHFYLDLFPRPGKYGHQCVLPIRPSFVRVQFNNDFDIDLALRSLPQRRRHSAASRGLHHAARCLVLIWRTFGVVVST